MRRGRREREFREISEKEGSERERVQMMREFRRREY